MVNEGIGIFSTFLCCDHLLYRESLEHLHSFYKPGFQMDPLELKPKWYAHLVTPLTRSDRDLIRTLLYS